MYRLYASYKKGRYKAVDWKNGLQVNNLIYATIFNKQEADKVLKEATSCDNPDFRFELRKV